MTIKVFDKYGNEQSWPWLVQWFGPVEIHQRDSTQPGWQVVAFFEVDDLNKGEELCGNERLRIEATSTQITKFIDADANPVEGVPLAWWWSDAHLEPGAVDCDGIMALRGFSNANGDVGNGMGDGAYYWPDQGQIGPHHIWPCNQNGDKVVGIGMVALTNHKHLDVMYQWAEPGEPPPEPPPSDDKLEKVRELLRAALDLLA